MKHRLNGAVTVLFSFVLVLLLSLVLVSVESARQQASAAILQTEVSLAVDSFAGQYYTPLFDQYGIYGIYKEDVKASLNSYLKGSLDPAADMPEDFYGDTGSGYSFAFSAPEVSVEKELDLTDMDGELMRKQMIEAGAVSGAEQVIEELLDTLGILKEQEQGIEMLEEKAKADERLTAMEILLQKLITAMDGIPTNYGGVVCDSEGKIHPERYFAKTLTAFEPTRQTVAVDSFAMFLALLPQYNNLLTLIELTREDREKFEADAEITGNTAWEYAEREVVRLMFDRTIAKNDETITVLSQLLLLQEELKPLLSEYEQKLEKAKGVLSEDWIEALSESIDTIRKYIGETGDFYDFRAMRTRIEKNRDILRQVRNDFEDYAESTAENWREILDRAEEDVKGLSFEGLNIRYEGMHRSTSVKDSVWKAIKNILVQGVSSGVLDTSAVSTKKMNSRHLPSETIGADAFDLFDIPSAGEFGGIAENTIWKFIRSLKLSDLAKMLRQGVEALTERALLTTYAKVTFPDYQTDLPEGRKTVLDYQLEYILYGEKADANNLYKAADGILGVRLLMNIIHMFTNPAKRATALATAVEIFGTALPILTFACQYVILFVWALQNAKLETAEILKGKKVPFLVTETSFQTSYGEILTTGKKERFERADQYEDATGVAPRYGTYLTLFLMLADEKDTVFRSMDLMQEQICLTDNPAFRMKDCLCGLAVSVRARLPGKYTNLPAIGFGGSDGCTVEAFGTFLY